MLRDIAIPNKQYNDSGDMIKFNRTGAVHVQFGAYFLDSTQGATGSANLDKGLNQIVGVTTALIAKRLPLVIASDPAAASYVAGDPMKVWEGQAVRCRVKVDGSGTAIAAGDLLKPVNASASMVKGTIGTDRCFLIAGAASSAAGDIIDALLFSYGIPGIS